MLENTQFERISRVLPFIKTADPGVVRDFVDYAYHIKIPSGMEIFSEGIDKEPQRIYAKPNRLIIFDAGKDPHRVSKVIEGTRKAIAINLWEYVPYSEINGKLKKEI